MVGGKREGAGRKPAPEHLKKVPFNTKLPKWLRDWLTSPERDKSGPVLIEEALSHVHKLKPPQKLTESEIELRPQGRGQIPEREAAPTSTRAAGAGTWEAVAAKPNA